MNFLPDRLRPTKTGSFTARVAGIAAGLICCLVPLGAAEVAPVPISHRATPVDGQRILGPQPTVKDIEKICKGGAGTLKNFDCSVRGDTRSPKEINAAHGFYSKGNQPGIPYHVKGVSTCWNAPSDSGYVATSYDPAVAEKFATCNNMKPNETRYVYVIKTSDRFYNVADVYKKCNQTYPYPDEKELAARGDKGTKLAVEYAQIAGWHSIKLVQEKPSKKYDYSAVEANPGYSASFNQKSIFNGPIKPSDDVCKETA